MAVDVLIPYVTRSSATLVLTVLVFQQHRFKLSGSSKCWEMVENANISAFYFFDKFSSRSKHIGRQLRNITAISFFLQKTSDGQHVSAITLTFMHLLSKAANHVGLLIPGRSASEKQENKAQEICQAAFASHPEFLQQSREAAYRTLSNPKYCGKMKVGCKLRRKWCTCSMPGVQCWSALTHCDLATPYGDIDLSQDWFW